MKRGLILVAVTLLAPRAREALDPPGPAAVKTQVCGSDNGTFEGRY